VEVFDVIIIGLGAMGTAAAYELSLRGKRVLGLESFTPAHDKGSSHGSSRIIRQAYYEHPSYVPLVLRAYELWKRLESDTGDGLLFITGGLSIGPSNSHVLTGSIDSARKYSLDHEVLDANETRRRFPQFVLEAEEFAFYEKKAGYLWPEECIRRQLAGAVKRGAELHFEEPMISWTAATSGEGVTVATSRATYRAHRLILSTGAWAPQALEKLKLPIKVFRRVMCWFDPRGGIDAFFPGRLPIYLWEPDNAPQFYGFPATDGPNQGAKMAIHVGDEACTPETIDRDIRLDDEQAVRSVIATRIPDLNGILLKARTCMYTMTPDENFIIELHREYPQVSIAAGFSGHGFKFSSVIGEILADLATRGETSHNIDIFTSQRFRKDRRRTVK
jgi:sarcosine oxidase